MAYGEGNDAIGISGSISGNVGKAVDRAYQAREQARLQQAAPEQSNACREWTPQELLLQRAEELRHEATELETLARALPGEMHPTAARALRTLLHQNNRHNRF